MRLDFGCGNVVVTVFLGRLRFGLGVCKLAYCLWVVFGYLLMFRCLFFRVLLVMLRLLGVVWYVVLLSFGFEFYYFFYCLDWGGVGWVVWVCAFG